MCKENINLVTKEELLIYHRRIYKRLKDRFCSEPFPECDLRKELGGTFRFWREDVAKHIAIYTRLGWIERCGKIGFHTAYIMK